MFDRRRILTSCVVLLMLLALANALGLFARSDAQAEDTAVLVDPPEGLPGDVVTVSGEGFEDESRGQVIWSATGEILGNFRTNDDGSFKKRIRIPDSPGGHYVIDVVAGGEEAQAKFHIIEASPPTDVPTDITTEIPTDIPTENPVDTPTNTPESEPTQAPSQLPTETPEPNATNTQVPTSATENEIIVEVGESIQAALDAAGEGETILLRGGAHSPPATLNTIRDGVTISSYPGETAVIDGGGTLNPVFLIEHAVTLSNITVANAGGTYGKAIRVGGSGAILDNVTAYGANEAAIEVAGSDVQVLRCDVSSAATGVQITGSNVTVDGCVAHDLTLEVNGGDCSKAHGGQGFAVNQSRGPVTIRNNAGWNNVAPSNCFGFDGAFVETWQSQNVRIEGNTSRDGVTFVETAGDTSGIEILNNVVTNQGFLTLHNSNGITISGNQVNGLTENMWFGGRTAGLAFTDNVISGGGRFFYINEPLNGDFTRNNYNWAGGNDFGVVAGVRYTTATGWIAAVEPASTVGGRPPSTATAAPSRTPTPQSLSTSAPSATASPTGTSTPTATTSPTSTTSPSPTSTQTAIATQTPTSASGGAVTLAAAGDVSCTSSGTTNCVQELTGDLIRQLSPDTVLVLGDMQYETSTSENLAIGYDPAWGSFKEITRPVAGGSHDFYGGGDWALYWGAQAGVANENWYSFELGSWHIVVLNSYCSTNGNCAAQRAWLAADLAANPNNCTLAAWHQPRYSSGSTHGNYSGIDWAWDMLYQAGAEVVMTSHEHNYERFAPINATDQRDDTFGMREFVVGTGGRSHYGFAGALPLSEARNSDTYGVIQMTLRDGGYDWSFVPVNSGGFTDSGSGTCHGAPVLSASGSMLADGTGLNRATVALVVPIAGLVIARQRRLPSRARRGVAVKAHLLRASRTIGNRLTR